MLEVKHTTNVIIYYMCQSRVEIEHYSVAFFDHITTFEPV